MTLRTLAIIGGALAFVLLMVLGWEMGWGRSIKKPFPEAEVSTSKPLEVTLLPEYKLGALQARKETIERPLFVPTRRPVPPEVVSGQPKSTMQRGLFVLSGTAIQGQTRIAFLRNAKDGKPKTVRVGDTVEGMVVSAVSADRVKLTLNGEEEELSLKVAAGPKNGAVQPGKPAAAQSAPSPVSLSPATGQPPMPQPRMEAKPLPQAAPTPSEATGWDQFEKNIRKRYQTAP